MFGVKPGEEYKKEGWENATFYAFIPMMVLFVVVYAFKPDTRYVHLDMQDVELEKKSKRRAREKRGDWSRDRGH